MSNSVHDLRARIDTIEEAYEYFLAYAAQGRTRDDPSVPVRSYLERLEDALDGLGSVLHELIDQRRLGPMQAQSAFLGVVQGDAAKALAAVRVVLGQPSIGSQLIDNLNASIHLRALLTDIFLLDETLKTSSPQEHTE